MNACLAEPVHKFCYRGSGAAFQTVGLKEGPEQVVGEKPLRVVLTMGFLSALALVGLVLVGLSFSLPADPVTTCVANLYGTFCTVHYLEGDLVISCGLRPNGQSFVSCIRSLPWWIDPIPFLYFESIQVRTIGIALLLSGIVGLVLVLVTMIIPPAKGLAGDQAMTSCGRDW